MPLPMVHLSIAVEICKHQNRDVTPDFLLGSIAPDSIHARPGTSRPDKDQTHLLTASHANTLDEEYYPRIRSFLMDTTDEVASADFVAGYAAHVLTDRIWLHKIYRPFRDKVSADLPREERVKLYYQTSDQIDIHLYNHMTWRPQIWSQLAASQPVDFCNLLSASEIAQWRDRTLDWYDLPENNPQIVPQHITYEQVITFIEEAAKSIVAYLEL